MGSIPRFLFLSLHCWCIGMQPISMHWFYILQLCWIHESALAVFLVGSFGYSIYSIMPSAKSECLTLSWMIWMPFISLCCLIAEAKTSNSMLNNSGESGHPCLVPDLRGKALSFFPLRMILALGRSYMAFIISRYAPSIYILQGFYQERMLCFVKCFLCIYSEDHVVLVLFLLM